MAAGAGAGPSNLAPVGAEPDLSPAPNALVILRKFKKAKTELDAAFHDGFLSQADHAHLMDKLRTEFGLPPM